MVEQRAVSEAPDLVAIGTQLRSLRLGRAVTQSELAAHTGMARTYIVALERGRHEPSLELLGRIALALRYPLPASTVVFGRYAVRRSLGATCGKGAAAA